MASRRSVQPSRSRRAGSGRTSGVFVTLAVLVLLGAFALAWLNRRLEPARPGDHEQIEVEIPVGATASNIAIRLTRAGIVRDALSLIICADLSGDASKLRPGIYELSPGDTPLQILNEMQGGRERRDLIVIPEGFTLRQIAQRLQDQNLANASAFLDVAEYQGRSFHCADGFTPPSDDLEGYLFPDTYRIAPGETIRQIAQEMLDQFDRVVVVAHPEVTDWRRPVIIASMVESEAEVEQDRPLISAVMYNRLRIGMPLQIDATVEYALPAHKARVMYSDLRTRSPYNTYLHRGLPPGPICDPGLPSIEAALDPANVNYLYYVQGPGKTHLFSRTLAEQDHNIAVVRALESAKH